VSKARINIAANRDKAKAFAATVFQPDLSTRGRENPLPRFRPLDEDDCALEVRLEISPLGCGHALETEQIEMGDVDAPAIPMSDREGGARDWHLHAESTTRAADERRLAGAKLAGDGHDVAGRKLRGQLRGDLLRLFRRTGLDQKRPS
jgi:hypothetical protein